VGVLGPDHHGGRRAIGHPGAVEHAQHPGDRRHAADLLDAHLLAELGLGVAGAVVVVLGGDAGQDLLDLVQLDAVLLGVGGGDHGEHGGGGQRAVGAVSRDREPVEPLVAGVLDLLAADGHGHVVGAAGHGVGRVAEGLRAGGAVVLHPGDGPVADADGLGQADARHRRLGRAEPVGVHAVAVDAG
jgi:hypothetical protein